MKRPWPEDAPDGDGDDDRSTLPRKGMREEKSDRDRMVKRTRRQVVGTRRQVVGTKTQGQRVSRKRKGVMLPVTGPGHLEQGEHRYKN